MCSSAVIHCAGQQAAVCHLLAGAAMTHGEPRIITSDTRTQEQEHGR